MTQSIIEPLTLKELKKVILEKTQNRNQELNIDFYSDNVEAYELVDINVFTDYKLLLLRCPKSRSTVSIKINTRTKQSGGENE
jgi:hypothetical protein